MFIGNIKGNNCEITVEIITITRDKKKLNLLPNNFALIQRKKELMKKKIT
ncbi:MAG: hypothetical protein QW818_02655 [Candidatus Aenigmatarchaeota archaeon]|nr:hypothetical protein [Candidatus Aenigmarchaeota archaeon]